MNEFCMSERMFSGLDCAVRLATEKRRRAAALQDASWTAVAERSGDTAFRAGHALSGSPNLGAGQSGVALRFPPQSKMLARFRRRVAVAKRPGVRQPSGAFIQRIDLKLK
jgi:hypothetical protein